MSHLRRARHRTRSSSDHERARRLVAEGQTETLGTEEMAWLAAHLGACQACREIALEYEAQRLALRALPTPEPPRDLWARTSAALDAEERRTAGGAAGRRLPALARTSLFPYGALASILVVAVVIGSALLAGGGPVANPGASSQPTVLPSLAAVPTPVAVSAEAVAWLAPQDDGTYALNVADVDRVCAPEAQPDCAPIDGSARQLLRLSSAPRAVLRSPQDSQIVVVDAATSSVGGSIYVVPIAEPTLPEESAAPSATPFAIESAPPTPTPSPEPTGWSPPEPSVEPLPTSEPTPEPTPEPSPEPSLEPSSAPSGGPTLAPTDEPSPGVTGEPTPSPERGGAIAIISDVIVVGETAAYSPDGSWFAFSARPADGSQGPDIYVWHVGDLLARPATSDHASIFSSWLGGLVLGSRAIPDPIVPAADMEPNASLAPSASPGSDTTPLSGDPASSSPVASAAATPTIIPEPPPSSAPGATPTPTPSPVVPTGRPTAFVLDPPTGFQVDLALPAWRPVVDPSGRYVVYWSGTLGFDAASATWSPLAGQLLIAPWAALVAIPAGSPLPVASVPPPIDGLASGSPDASSLPEEAATPEPTAAPTEPPTEPPTPSPSPSVEQTVPSLLPGEAPGPSGGILPSPTPFTPLVGPETLLPQSAPSMPVTEWDVHWDPSGTRLAVWIGDPVDPSLGRLSLLGIDQPTGRVDNARSLLLDAPALAGFSIDEGRLAWATPPGQDGTGSRLLVLAWDEAGTGQLDSQPAMGSDEVVVVR